MQALANRASRTKESLKAHAKNARTLWAWDLWVALPVTGLIWAFGRTDAVRDNGVTILLASAAGGAAFLATVLTALGILITQFDGPYRKVLERPGAGGVQAALQPYFVVSVVSATTSFLGVVSATIWAGITPALGAVLMALTIGTAVWATAGMLDLVRLTIFHIESRTQIERTLGQIADARTRQGRTRPRPRAEQHKD